MNLEKYHKNIHSQYGEDGILDQIFSTIPVKEEGWCVEFGAWDGMHLSNTCHLILDLNWNGILIEPHSRRFRQLINNYGVNKRVSLLNVYVDIAGQNTLDKILSNTKIPINYNLLSIDIDGNDYHIWKTIQKYQPKVVVIEYNPTIPPNIEYIQPYDPKITRGSSLLSLYNLAKEKGYELIFATDSNAIFVLNKYFNLFKILDNSPEKIMPKKYLTFFYQFSDGTIGLSGCKRLLSHGIDFKDEDFQILPRYLRHFPSWYLTIMVKLYKGKWKDLQEILRSGLITLISNFVNAIRNLPSRTRVPVRFVINVARSLFWWVFERGVHPPQAYKILLLLSYSIRYRTKVFIETGTFMGDTVDCLKYAFRKIYSIEIYKPLYLRAKEYFKKDKNIEIIQGDSGKILPKLLRHVKEPALFWLDAHYSGEGTSKGSLDTPIVKELSCILQYKELNHVVLIDDAREFNGKNSYPKLDQFVSSTEKKWENYRVVVKNDVIRIFPVGGRQFKK